MAKKESRRHAWLGYASAIAFAAIGLLTAHRKNVVLALAVLMGFCLLYAFWDWVDQAETTAEKMGHAGGLLVACVAVSTFFGWLCWPDPGRHTLDEKEIAAFQEPLKTQKDPDKKVQIACPANDEATCTYASQFIPIFGNAGWNVNGELLRGTPGRATPGVHILQHSDQKQDRAQWQQYAWVNITNGLIDVRRAFVHIGIEPSVTATMDAPANQLTIYFGLLRTDESAPTDLTKNGREIRESIKSGKTKASDAPEQIFLP